MPTIYMFRSVTRICVCASCWVSCCSVWLLEQDEATDGRPDHVAIAGRRRWSQCWMSGQTIRPNVGSLIVFIFLHTHRWEGNMFLSKSPAIARPVVAGFEHIMRLEHKFICCDSHLRAITAGPASIIADKVASADNRHRHSFLDIPAPRKLPLLGTKLDFLMAGAGKKWV